MEQNISPNDNQEVVKNPQNKLIITLKVFSGILLLVVAFLFGIYFSGTQTTPTEVEKKPSMGSFPANVRFANSGTIQNVDVSRLSGAIREQQYPRYAVIDNRELVLVSLNGGQAIRPEVGEISYGGGALGFGSTNPDTSPDMKKVAYIDGESNLHVMNSKGDVDILVSDSLEVRYISGWSADSEKLLFYVRGETINTTLNPEGMMYEVPDTVEYSKKNYPNGFYLLDIDSGDLSHIAVFENVQFESWINSSQILVSVNQYGNEKFVVFDTLNYIADFSMVGGDLEKDFGSQYSFSEDGSKWAITWHGGDGGTNSASIILADFPSVDGQELMKSAFAQIQGPVISPDGKQVAFRGYDEVNGPLYTYLYDGNSVEKVIDGFPRRWISNTEFLVLETDPTHATNPQMGARLFVYDTETRSATQVYSFSN